MWAGFISPVNGAPVTAQSGNRDPGNGRLLRAVLGPSSILETGPGYGLGVVDGRGDRTHLDSEPHGEISATIGDPRRAGVAATIHSSRHEVSLACDPFGFHGAFTIEQHGLRWFASDARLLRRLPGVPTGLDPLALGGYLCFSHVPTPCSIASGVEALRAGDCVTFGGEGERRESYADWREADRFLSDQEHAIAELRARLESIVRRQLGADTEVGVFLSGGLDSSLVAALLAEVGATVHLFTLDFGEPFNAEIPYAQRVADHLKRPLRIVRAGPKEIGRALVPTAAVLQQPFGDAVTVPLYLLGEAAAIEVETVFNGEGGDQLFGGWANKPMIAAELHAEGRYDRLAAYMETYHRFYGLEDRIYTPAARATLADIDPTSWVRAHLERDGFTTLLHRLRAANLWLKGAQNIAPRATQLARAHGLRMRAPFFDPELTAWTFSLPPEWFLQGSCEKLLLKRVAAQLLPEDVVWREKRGMGVPSAEWCLGSLRHEVGRWLGDRRVEREGWLDPEYVRALRRGEDGPGEYRQRRVGEKLWALLMLQVWRDAQDPPVVLPSLEASEAFRSWGFAARQLGRFRRALGSVGGDR